MVAPACWGNTKRKPVGEALEKKTLLKNEQTRFDKINVTEVHDASCLGRNW